MLDITTESPWQNVVGRLAVIVGADGVGFTVTTTALETADEHPFATTYPEIVPLLRTTTLETLVAPVLQFMPVPVLDVMRRLSPEQNVVAPEADRVGVAGMELTKTEIGFDTVEVQPKACARTEYAPLAVTIKVFPVDPFDQILFSVPVLEITTESPWQNVVGRLAVIVGADGVGFTVTTTALETADEHPFATTYPEIVPLLRTTTLETLVAPVLQFMPVPVLDVMRRLSPEQNVVAPEADRVGAVGD